MKTKLYLPIITIFLLTLSGLLAEGISDTKFNPGAFGSFDLLENSQVMKLADPEIKGFKISAKSVSNTFIGTDFEKIWSARKADKINYEYDSSLITIIIILPPPDLVSPDDESTDESLTLTFDWDEVQGAETYNLQVSENSDFSDPVIEEYDMTDTEYTVSSGTLDYNTTYYWQVQAQSSMSQSDWVSREFTTEELTLDAPVLASPEDMATDQSVTPTLDWDAVTNAESYNLQVSENSDFSDPVVDETDISETGLTIGEGNLENSRTYHWRVRAVASSTTSDWASRQLTTEESIDPPSAPSLVLPENYNWNVSVIPELDWSDVTGADSYGVQIASDRDFTNIVFEEDGITESGIQVGENVLNYRQIYYWRANAANSGGNSDWSGYWYFRTERVPRPVMVSPENGESDVSLTPTLDWEEVTNADSYVVQVSESRMFTNLIIDETVLSSTEFEVPGSLLEYGERYYLRVKAIAGTSESRWSSRISFNTIALEVPVLVSPSNREQDVSVTPVMDWEDVVNLDAYHLQVSIDRNFNNLVFENSTLTDSEYSVPSGELSFGSKYYWRVRVVLDGQNGEWTNSYEFTTMVIGVPSLVSPRNNARNQSLTPTLDWSDVDAAEYYTLEVSTNRQFSNIVHEETDLTDSECDIPDNTLEYSERYYWRVRTHIGSEYGSWSRTNQFNTRKAKTVEFDDSIVADNFIKEISMYPNPASEFININISLSEKSDIEMIITDMLGRQVLVLNKPWGNLIKEMINLKYFSSGTYYLLIRFEDRQIMRKFIKQ